MRTVLVTGSNRGLGVEWVRQYASKGWRVYATCRFPGDAEELRNLADRDEKISVHRLDVTRPDQINAVSVELLDRPVDLLISNAGIYLEKYKRINLGSINYDDWRYTFEVNTLGHIRLVEAFMPCLALSNNPLCVIITTHMASITDISEPGSYYYRSTKSALNATMEGLTYELKNKNIGVLLLHPGWVKTRMGGDGTDLVASESVRGMKKLVEKFTMDKTGSFYRYDGVEMPW